MAELLAQLEIWIESVVRGMGYPGITLLMVLESIFPPIPSELVLPFAGFMVSDGVLNPWWVIASSTIGAVAGALILYGLAAWADEPLARAFLRRYGRWFGVSEAMLDKGLRLFERFGVWVVLLGRLAPGIRSIVSLPAGLDHMRLGVFMLLTTAGSLLWNSGLIYMGMRLGTNWTRILEWVERYEDILLVAGVAILLVLSARWLVNRRRITA